MKVRPLAALVLIASLVPLAGHARDEAVCVETGSLSDQYCPVSTDREFAVAAFDDYSSEEIVITDQGRLWVTSFDFPCSEGDYCNIYVGVGRWIQLATDEFELDYASNVASVRASVPPTWARKTVCVDNDSGWQDCTDADYEVPSTDLELTWTVIAPERKSVAVNSQDAGYASLVPSSTVLADRAWKAARATGSLWGWALAGVTGTRLVHDSVAVGGP